MLFCIALLPNKDVLINCAADKSVGMSFTEEQELIPNKTTKVDKISANFFIYPRF